MANMRAFISSQPIILVLVALVAAFTIVADGFADATNISNVLRQTSMLGIVAIGMSIVVLTGGIDLSVGAVVALATVLVAGIANTHPPILGINLALIAGAAVGFINGILIAGLRLQPIIVTVSTMAVVRGLAMWLSDSRPIFGTLPKEFFQLAEGLIAGIPVPVIIFAVLAVTTMLFLGNTRTGRAIYQIGGNEEAAVLSGIRVGVTEVIAYTLCGTFAAVAGIILTARMQSGDAVRTGMGWELDAIAAVAVGGISLTGGRGHLVGAICGVLIIGFLANAFNLMGINPYWQRIVIGLVLAVAVIAYNERVRAILLSRQRRQQPTRGVPAPAK
ncbi:ABC transporter permease [Rhizobium laguerreae]|uniref:ABC transporter permease n=1 Tax=Rhizobium laguerreae TaxID=1076926 RepID=UPI001C90CEA6|nr:ABC transporter permease [Rhizobium laguerreae]MBY3259693.1 ABC transporter permease [Rhizobium laguerreae]MBY3287335.1 ABC transporter permease [Rhizobium laguerreae]MBY3294027.1 ABC transporter permease [Rhizobium laguerreae]